ncbi:MAG TPA: hypothetical protein VF746_22660 [Longimicrobium sp.]
MDRYAQLGVKLPPGNRLQRARDFLEEVNAPGELPASPSERFLRRIVDSTHTCFEHHLIARALASRPLDAQQVRLIQQSLSGSDLADDDTNSLPRDTQFELFAAAFLTMGDVPVRYQEPPDLVFLYNQREVGLAVKRVKSLSQLPRRFKKGIEQLDRSGLNGFVAVNADVLIRDIGLDGTAEELGKRFSARLNALAAIDARFASDPRALGRFTFGTDAVWDLSGARPELKFGFFRQVVFYNKNQEDKAVAERFYAAMDEKIEQRMTLL